jgi:hypothetical protein
LQLVVPVFFLAVGSCAILAATDWITLE